MKDVDFTVFKVKLAKLCSFLHHLAIIIFTYLRRVNPLAGLVLKGLPLKKLNYTILQGLKKHGFKIKFTMENCMY